MVDRAPSERPYLIGVRTLRRSCLLVSALGGCVTHTVTVFVPTKDVHTTVPILAAEGGELDVHYDVGAELHPNGVVKNGDRVIGRLQPDDVAVIRATAGDVFGPLHLVRGHKGDPLIVVGAATIVLGVGASWIFGMLCMNQAGRGDEGLGAGLEGLACLEAAWLATAASLGVGIPFLVYGIRSETLVQVHPTRNGATAGVSIPF